jgi:hypothetical protein
MGTQQKNRKSHKTDALMRLLMSGSSGAVNPSVSVTFKEDIIRPINDKKNRPSPLPIPEEPPLHTTGQPHPLQPTQPRTNVSFSGSSPATQHPSPARPAPLQQNPAPDVQKPQRTAEFILPPPENNLFSQRINPDKPAEMDIVRELTKELLPTAIQRFNVCYCDSCYLAMTEAVAKRSPKIVIMIRSKDDLARAEYLKKQNRNNVLRTVIKEVLEYKTKGAHNNILKN